MHFPKAQAQESSLFPVFELLQRMLQQIVLALLSEYILSGSFPSLLPPYPKPLSCLAWNIAIFPPLTGLCASHLCLQSIFSAAWVILKFDSVTTNISFYSAFLLTILGYTLPLAQCDSAKLVPASGTLHLLFFWAGDGLPQFVTWLTALNTVFREAFPDLPI